MISFPLFAHNGKVAYAYPLEKITVDGDLSDWPQNAMKYFIQTEFSDSKPKSSSDFSGFFQVGYRMDNRSIYIAFTITDDSFVEDLSDTVRWNTQDCLELAIDARHILHGSGVASFMYSKKLRNTNKAFYDPFASKASWDIVEVVMVQKGNTRIYEWRIKLDDELQPRKSIGLDFVVFDKDSDGSFTFAGWGKGGQKFRNPNGLGDIVFLIPSDKLASVSGKVEWNKPKGASMPEGICFVSTENPKLWFETELDSLGNYSANVFPATYQLKVSDSYISGGDNVYSTIQKKPLIITARVVEKTSVPTLTISATPEPDLIPEKGILLDFNSSSEAKVDQFIETYRSYYNIPGVSLALIKDGKMIYHKTYGVENTMTKEKVDETSLFEAASITKPVFAFAVQRLAERGVIDLDKPLYLYLPYKDIENDERYKLITARHVLTHRTGFPNWRWMNENGKLNIRFTPGTAYNYSGEGFEYLKLVIEKITGKKVEQVLKEEVLDPVGLYHTFFSKNDSLQQMVANGHYDGLPQSKDLPESPGMAWSMHTEASIFTKFWIYMLEQKGLSAKTYDEMMSKHSDFNYDPGDEKPKYPTYMGESLEIRETPWGKSFGHGGNNGDFKCKAEVYKDSKMGYIIFTNSNTSDGLLGAIRMFLVEGKEK